MSTVEQIKENLNDVRHRIGEAAQRSGRAADDVTLVAVTKYSDSEQTRLIVQAGCRHLGENRPQQLWEKAAAFADDLTVEWHQIGHLQRNKVARTIPLIGLLHSVDSLRLLAEVERAASTTPRKARVLLEVNVSGDESKHGWKPEEMPSVVDAIAEYPHVEFRGLMTMATLGGDETITRANFSSLRQLRDDLQQRIGDAADLADLSMGMSRDYEWAIEEGATIVRVGSAIVK